MHVETRSLNDSDQQMMCSSLDDRICHDVLRRVLSRQGSVSRNMPRTICDQSQCVETVVRTPELPQRTKASDSRAVKNNNCCAEKQTLCWNGKRLT